jgi:hypothetical protein
VLAAAMRAATAHPHLTAAAAVGLVVLAYLWPVLVGGKILSPVALLYGLPPWAGGSKPSDLHSYFNFDLVDVPLAIYPWRLLVRDLLHAGVFPAWNSQAFAGTPLYTNPANGLFTPFSLPLWFLPLNYAIGLGAALKLWVAGFGTYLLARELRLGLLPGLLAGVGFAFSALNIVWLTHESLPAVAALLPWVVFLIERILMRGGDLASAIALAVATAFGIGGGHAGMQVHILILAGLYALIRVALLADAQRRDQLRALAYAFGGLGAGAALMGVMLLPEALSAQGTIGTVARHGGKGSLPGTQMPFDAIKTVLFPDWWGRPSAFQPEEISQASAGGAVVFEERTFYAGVVTLFFALVALAARGEWRRKAPFLVLAVLGLAIPLHAPGLYWLATHLPILADVQSQRLHFAYAFGAAVLAAFGLQALIARPLERRLLLVPALAGLTAIVAWAGSGASGADLGRTIRHFATGTDFPRAGVLVLTSIGWFALLAAGASAALLAARRWPGRSGAIALLVVLLAVLDMLHFVHGLQPMAPPERAIPPVTPAIAYLQRHEHEGRYVGLGTMLGWEWAQRYGLSDVRGYEPPQPTLRYYELWLVANPVQTNWQPFMLESLTRPALNVVSTLGARYVAAEPGTRIASGGDPMLKSLKRVYSGSDAIVYLNPEAPPRALVAPVVKLTESEAQTRAVIGEEAFDPRRAVVVERDQPGAAALAAGPPVHGRVAIVHERNAAVTLHAVLDRPGLVMLGDDFTSGWSVRVDGHPAKALHVDDVMRGVAVGAGSHEITWSYSVPGLGAGIVLSLLAFLGLAGGAVALGVRARRARREAAAHE